MYRLGNFEFFGLVVVVAKMAQHPFTNVDTLTDVQRPPFGIIEDVHSWTGRQFIHHCRCQSFWQRWTPDLSSNCRFDRLISESSAHMLHELPQYGGIIVGPMPVRK